MAWCVVCPCELAKRTPPLHAPHAPQQTSSGRSSVVTGSMTVIKFQVDFHSREIGTFLVKFEFGRLLTERRTRSAAGWPRARDALRRGRRTFSGGGSAYGSLPGAGDGEGGDTATLRTRSAEPSSLAVPRGAGGGLCHLPRPGLACPAGRS